jgi:group I intron endonuclease
MTSIPRTSGIYQILCAPTGKIYIGSALDLRQRWATHRSALARNNHRNSYLQAAWNKYGESSFTFTVLELVLPGFHTEREQYYINHFKAADRRYGFNLAPQAGSCLGVKHTPETRQRMGEAHRGLKMPPFSDEHRQALSDAARERMADPDRRDAVSRVHKGKRLSPEHRDAFARAGSGPRTPAQIQATIDTHALDYIVTDPDGNEYEIRNLAEFCREHGLGRASMRRMAQGRQSTPYRGWRCRYK